ncbi:MAG TPA: type II secretion system protein [Candidatus Ozemobacteraceae bacterium]|nr:type II secretion system protein [Candidatus Ozemobacteraceae bacterium]HQG29271.1 type II secretion system protein [Candidatus Ozemobacteraceae bacterium]
MLKAARIALHAPSRGAIAARRGLSLIEMIIVVSVISVLALMALPTVELFDMKTRERMLRDRLYDMRLAIDRYRNARMDNLPPKSIRTLLDVIPEAETRSRATEGPFLTLGQTQNPFTPNDDMFRWDLRFIATSPAASIWVTNVASIEHQLTNSRVFDVRFPADPTFIGGWRIGFDDTLYKDW